MNNSLNLFKINLFGIFALVWAVALMKAQTPEQSLICKLSQATAAKAAVHGSETLHIAMDLNTKIIYLKLNIKKYL